MDPIIEQASHQFLSDDSFVKSKVFHQFAWWANMGKFEEKCKKLRTEHPEMDETTLQNQVKGEMMQ